MRRMWDVADHPQCGRIHCILAERNNHQGKDGGGLQRIYRSRLSASFNLASGPTTVTVSLNTFVDIGFEKRIQQRRLPGHHVPWWNHRLIIVKQRSTRLRQEAWDEPQKMISKVLMHLKYDDIVSTDDKYNSPNCRFIAVERWDSVVFIVCDLFNINYNQLNAHLDGKNE
jgi:hypothetical protein